MSNLPSFFKRSFILDIKKTIAYPASFWIVALAIPLYSIVQIAFLETIYRQTSNFVGYTKYEAYMLFGTYEIVQTIGHLFLYTRLSELKSMITGGGQESFDIALLKPIDAQIFATLGKFSFGNISPFFIAIFLIIFGLLHEPQELNIFNILSYFLLIILGTLVFYFTFLFVRTFIFWFPDLQVTESIWEVTREYGQYPSNLYQGALGILLNLVIPLTLMASVPVSFLLGRIPSYMLAVYTTIILIIFLFTRWFWNVAVKKYSSFSS